MQRFDFQMRTRFVVGEGVLQQLGAIAQELRGTRVLVVSDPGIVQAGLFERAVHSLRAGGMQIASFHDFQENPDSDQVDRGVQVAKEFQPDLLVGLGGGSSMDCAKGINFVHSCGGRIHDYWGVGKASKPMLPLIAVPTTAGTGSESQSFALISDAVTHAKMACGDPKAAARVALLDPLLTLSQPPRVTALTGIDALTHAIESFVCQKRSPISQLFAKEAWRHLRYGLPQVLSDPQSVDGRFCMQWGAALAGMAIEASMLGAAHALANPLTAHHGIAHGQAVGVMMPHVIQWNARQVASWYQELWNTVEPPLQMTQPHKPESDANVAARKMSDWFGEMLQAGGLHQRLAALAIPENDLEVLASQAAQQWTAKYNPVEVHADDLIQIYRRAL
ncbi:MAG: iron-containing alcohol dehydrogenase [Pirellulaceae bacterium]|jgi:alcohol dehydrogenase